MRYQNEEKKIIEQIKLHLTDKIKHNLFISRKKMKKRKLINLRNYKLNCYIALF